MNYMLDKVQQLNNSKYLQI